MSVTPLRNVQVLDNGLELTIGKRGEHLFDRDNMNNFILGELKAGVHIKRRVSGVSKELENAALELDGLTEIFDRSLSKLVIAEKSISESSKAVSGRLRDSASKLGEGLARIEKTANFDRLERLTELLERSASAMTILADLEQSGKLEKITNAMK